jgi:hypothetical protein
MFDEFSLWLLLGFLALLGLGSVVSKAFNRRMDHDDRIHPAE